MRLNVCPSECLMRLNLNERKCLLKWVSLNSSKKHAKISNHRLHLLSQGRCLLADRLLGLLKRWEYFHLTDLPFSEGMILWGNDSMREWFFFFWRIWSLHIHLSYTKWCWDFACFLIPHHEDGMFIVAWNFYGTVSFMSEGNCFFHEWRMGREMSLTSSLLLFLPSRVWTMIEMVWPRWRKLSRLFIMEEMVRNDCDTDFFRGTTTHIIFCH